MSTKCHFCEKKATQSLYVISFADGRCKPTPVGVCSCCKATYEKTFPKK